MSAARAMRVAVLDDYQQAALQCADWSVLNDAAQIEVFHDHLFDADALVQRLLPFDVVCLMRERTPMPAAIIKRLPNLKLIVTTGHWNAAIDLDCARARGITVCGTTSIRTPTAGLTWMFIFALARQLPAQLQSMRSGGWQVDLGLDVQGMTLGLLGLGSLGSRVARQAQAFDMKVLAWSQNLTDEHARSVGAQRVDKDELLAHSDFVSIHLILSARTRHLIGAREVALMKPGAFLINTSRGPIVDEAALVQALRERRIAGAGIDVFDPEPTPADHPLRHLDNAICTPHIGYVTQQGYRHFFPQVVDNIVQWMAGEPVRLLEQHPAAGVR